MTDRIKVGLCGVGAFADCFIPLFKAHPLVKEIVLCDLVPEKLKSKAERFGVAKTCPSLDALCQSDVDAIAIITQHHLHGPQAVQALQAGKHVYSAVPSAISMEEITALVRSVEATGKIYMVGETSYYYPCAIYCRNRYRAGDFGRIVYGEGEYYHDYVHGMYAVAKNRHGKSWKQYYGMPPMFYPTHSTSMIVSVTGAHVTHVSGLGFVDRHPDNLYARKDNVWKNRFSNETMLCRMSDGSMARISEFRRIGHPGTVGMSLYGTEASYEEQVGGQMWATKSRATCIDLRDTLRCRAIPAGEVTGVMAKVTGADGTHMDVSSVHPVHLLPKEYLGLSNGHNGSHQFLVHDFITACVSGKTPPNNVWDAARYLVPGLIAHESALQGGVLREVPDFGDPPDLKAERAAEQRKILRLVNRREREAMKPRADKWVSPFMGTWKSSKLFPRKGDVGTAKPVRLADPLDWKPVQAQKESGFVNLHPRHENADGIAYAATRIVVKQGGEWDLRVGYDGGCAVFVDGKRVLCVPKRRNPATPDRSTVTLKIGRGRHEIVCALDTDHGKGWGVFLRFAVPEKRRKRGMRVAFPAEV